MTAPAPTTALETFEREFRHHLPPDVNAALSKSMELRQRLYKLSEHGWTAAQLAAACTTGMPADIANAGALVMHRLKERLDTPPPPVTRVSRLGVAPLCGHCDAGWLLDEDMRPVERCPCRLGDH